MTRDEAVSIIQQQLGFRTDLSSEIITNLKLAQTMLEAGPTRPWFLVTEQQSISLEVGEQRLVVPSNMLAEIDQARLVYIPDDSDEAAVDLVKEDYDQLARDYAEVDNGPPEAYALLGNYFRIFPTPDDDYTIKIIVFGTDADLSSNIENGWLKHVPYALIGKAGAQIASAIRDNVALAVFREWEREGRLALQGKDVARDVANRVLQVGGPH